MILKVLYRTLTRRLYYHIVWATKQRLPLIKPELEAKLYGYIIGKADYLGCITQVQFLLAYLFPDMLKE